MNWFIVRGPNWKINKKVSEKNGDNEYRYIEAATRAIEDIYSGDCDDADSFKFSSIIQVSLSGYDVESTEEDAMKDLVEHYTKNGYIKFLFMPLILANAGKFAQAEYLKGIIENNQI